MRMHRILLVLVIVPLLSGCIDQRIKRLASVSNAKTQVAKKEIEAAKTDAEKAKIAIEYFKLMPDMTQTIEDYVMSRKPQDKAEVVAVPPTKAEPVPDVK